MANLRSYRLSGSGWWPRLINASARWWWRVLATVQFVLSLAGVGAHVPVFISATWVLLGSAFLLVLFVGDAIRLTLSLFDEFDGVMRDTSGSRRRRARRYGLYGLIGAAIAIDIPIYWLFPRLELSLLLGFPWPSPTEPVTYGILALMVGGFALLGLLALYFLATCIPTSWLKRLSLVYER